jgi:cyanosortase A-associated protein
MHWKKPRIYFLTLTFSIGLLVSLISILFPSFGKPKNRTLIFPKEVPLKLWQLSNSQPMQVVVEKYPNLLSHITYHYVKKDLNLNIDMRYLQNFYPADVTLLKKNDDTKKSPNIVRYKDGVGYYGLGLDEQNAYLSACINPRGGSTFTHAQYRNNRYSKDINFERLLPVLQGQEALIDKRCLLVNLSIPLQNSSPENAYKVLEQAWFSWYQWWQPRFPKP